MQHLQHSNQGKQGWSIVPYCKCGVHSSQLCVHARVSFACVFFNTQLSKNHEKLHTHDFKQLRQEYKWVWEGGSMAQHTKTKLLIM